MHKALAFLVTFKVFLVKCKTENSNNSNNNAIEGEEVEGTSTSVSSEASGGSSSEKYPVEITFNKTDDMR